MNIREYLVALFVLLATGCTSTAELGTKATTIVFPVDSATVKIDVKNNQQYSVNYTLELEQNSFLHVRFFSVNADALFRIRDPQGNLFYEGHRLTDWRGDEGFRSAVKLGGRYLVTIEFPASATQDDISSYLIAITKVQQSSKDDAIHISQSGCYGTCPVFNAYLFADGHYVMEGEQYTPIIGITQGQLPPAEVAAVFAAYAQANMAQFQTDYVPYNKEQCPNYATDQSTRALTYSAADTVHSISHYLGCIGNDDLNQLAALEFKVIDLFIKHGVL
ncbi:DUF6438 domain-containing protein [Shewanella sp. A3A]|nr:DUF6438 domain-containing protein [Shewanella ferrihydritica]